MRPVLMRAATIVVAVAAIVGCSDVVSLSEDGPIGDYTAIILYSTTTTGQRDELANSGTFTITLKEDGTTSGRLRLVAFGGNPAVDADMAGTWTRNGDTIDFTQSADTFVRDMTFTIEQITDRIWYLVGDDVFAGTRINVRLAQDS